MSNGKASVISLALVIAFLAAPLQVAAAGSSSQDRTDITTILGSFPKGDYFIMMGGRPSEIYNSPLFQAAKQYLEQAQWPLGFDFSSLDALADTPFGDMRNFDTVILALQGSLSDPVPVLYTDGGFNGEVFASELREKRREVEEKQHGGIEYWLCEEEHLAFWECPGGLFFTTPQGAESVIRSAAAGGSVLEQPDFSEAAAMVDIDSSLFVLMWGEENALFEGFSEGFVGTLAYENWMEPVAEALRETQALAFALNISGEFRLEAGMLFKDAASAEVAFDFLELAEAVAVKGGKYYLKHVPSAGLDYARVSEALRDARHELSQDSARVRFRFAVKEESVRELLKTPEQTIGSARDMAKQAASLARMKALGQAIMMYQMDYNRLPDVAGIEELADLFMKEEILADRDIIRDGWGNLLVYSLDAELESCTLTCLGSDGEPGPEPRRPGVVEYFDEDPIWRDGVFVQSPEGPSKSREGKKKPF